MKMVQEFLGHKSFEMTLRFRPFRGHQNTGEAGGLTDRRYHLY